jgi:hypothetical protein
MFLIYFLKVALLLVIVFCIFKINVFCLGCRYLQSTISESQRQACHFFNSFFFRKLADLDKFPDTEVVSREAFVRVRKWTRRVNIFEKDYIFIPVNYRYVIFEMYLKHRSFIEFCCSGFLLHCMS